MPWHEGELSSGLPLYVVPDDSLPWVSIRLVLRTGARNDRDRPGLADFTSGLLSAGSGDRDAVTFAEDVEYLGADLGAEAGHDSFVVELGSLHRYVQTGVDIMADMLLAPHFEQDEIERERTQHIAGLRSLHSEPDWLAERAARRRVMSGTPYSEPVEGTERAIRDIGRQNVVEYHRHLLESTAFIVASGAIDVEELHGLLEGRLVMPSGRLSPPPSPTYLHQEPEPAFLLVDRHGSAHTSLRIARPAVPRCHPDYIPLRVLTTILGDYFNSRLNNRLREDLGYTYGAWASLEGKLDGGAIWIGTSVASQQIAVTIDTIREEIDRLGNEEVTLEELELVTRYIAGRHALSRETPEQVAGLISNLLLYDLPRDHYGRTLESIRELTPELLLETAQKYFRSGDFTIVAAGEGERLLPELEKSGNVEVVGD